MKDFLNKFRWTGLDWLDHSINVIPLWFFLRYAFKLVITAPTQQLIWATFVTIVLCILLEICQDVFDFGEATTSDVASGALPALALFLGTLNLAYLFNWYDLDGYQDVFKSISVFWLTLIYAVALAAAWYWLVYKQLKGKLK